MSSTHEHDLMLGERNGERVARCKSCDGWWPTSAPEQAMEAREHARLMWERDEARRFIQQRLGDDALTEHLDAVDKTEAPGDDAWTRPADDDRGEEA